MDKNHLDKTVEDPTATENTLPPSTSEDQKKLDRLRKDHKKAKHPLLVVAMSAALVGVILLVYLWFRFSWPLWALISLMLIGILLLIYLIQASYTAPWTGFRDKKLWDWLNLLGVLAVPLLLGLATLLFTAQQAQSSLDQQRADTLQKYVDNVQDLLLTHNLGKSSSFDQKNPYYDVAILARARTLTALQGLDPERKGRLLKFLYDAELIGFINDGNVYPPIITLNGADLTGADLSGANIGDSLSRPNIWGADLGGANLSDANLSGADLSGASLNGANLSGANLTEANLTEANFGEENGRFSIRGAELSSANFNEANLTEANFHGADLTDASNLTQQQLDQVYSCFMAMLTQPLTCNQNATSDFV